MLTDKYMKHCSSCGSLVRLKIPHGDNRERSVCDDCGTIHYVNPKLVTGCIPVWGEQILLCRRAIEPRYGKWTLPAGFMENGETTANAAVRETMEEANAEVEVESLFSLINIPYIDQVYLFFRAKLLVCEYSPGEESLEVELMSESQVPWDSIAFPAVTQTLQWYFSDRKAGLFETHTGDILKRPSR